MSRFCFLIGPFDPGFMMNSPILGISTIGPVSAFT
jgi:hypothetical protein